MRVSADIDEAPLLEALDAALSRGFGRLRRPAQKNLAVLSVAFLRLLGAARGGNGQLSLSSIARVMPSSGTAHARDKRLWRFLRNPRLDPRGVTDGLVQLVIGRRGRGLWPIVFDQTTSGNSQALVAGVPFEGRVLPLSTYTFEYPWQEPAAKSQNQLEHVFLLDIETALPDRIRPVFIGDRGYARAALLRQCGQENRLFLIRGRGGTRILGIEGKRKLHHLYANKCGAIRYPNVQYQAKERVLVDVIAYHDPDFQEPWWLLVPANSEDVLPTDVVVALYRERMQVEQSFRDFKTHLGLRGLRLEVSVTERIGRLLLAFCVAYCLALVLGVSPEAQRARSHLEVPRRVPRHGTCRRLSVLSIAMQMLSHPHWRASAYHRLLFIAELLASDRCALPRAPPQVAELVCLPA